MKQRQIELAHSDGAKFTYVISHLDTSIGLEGAARLANISAPGASALPDIGFEGFKMATLLSGLLGNRDLAEHLKWFAGEFAKRTQVVMTATQSRTLADIYETHFQGEYGALSQWLQACLEHCYGSFLAPARAAVAKFLELASLQMARAILKPPSPAQKTDSGPSGASFSAVALVPVTPSV